MGLLLVAIAVGILWAIQTNEQAAVNQGVETVYTEMENAPESSSGAATVGNNRERGVES